MFLSRDSETQTGEGYVPRTTQAFLIMIQPRKFQKGSLKKSSLESEEILSRRAKLSSFLSIR